MVRLRREVTGNDGFVNFEDIYFRYGNVISSKAILDQKSGQCKGYGFAMYEKEDDCHRAIDDLNRRGLQASFARVGQVKNDY